MSGEGNSGDVTVWMKGFLFPRRNSTFKFTYTTNGAAKLFLSTDKNPANKVEVADSGTVTLQADT